MNNTNFGKEVKRAFPNSDRTQVRRDGKRIRLYTGIAQMELSETTV